MELLRPLQFLANFVEVREVWQSAMFWCMQEARGYTVAYRLGLFLLSYYTIEVRARPKSLQYLAGESNYNRPINKQTH